MKITLNYAGNGDCILIESGDSCILVDGGTAASYDTWKKRVNKLEKINCIAVTHIDRDHVNGIIKLLESNKKPEIEYVLFNGAEQVLGGEFSDIKTPDDRKLRALSERLVPLSEEESVIGVSEGTSLSYSLKKNKIKSNETALVSNDSEQIDFDGLTLKTICPSKETLNKLKAEWLEALNDEGIKRKIINNNYALAFETYINSLQNIYSNNIAADTLTDVSSLADFIYKKDSSLANKSSLAFLIEDKDSSILMLGDCHAEDVIAWLNKNKISKLAVDAVKISHHGSKNNINKELVERLNCDTYLISTNGKIFNHPDLETLAVIAKYSTKKNNRIIINNLIEHISEKHIKMFYDFNRTELILNQKEINL
ncbi:MAG: beta-lactamase superfamily II metal-dependent hydrolase [Psychroserpens sp.]